MGEGTGNSTTAAETATAGPDISEQETSTAEEAGKKQETEAETESGSDLAARIAAAEKLAKQSASENKKLRTQLDKLRRAHLSDEELQADEQKRKDEELTEREQKLRDSENRFYTVQALKKAGLDDGSESALKLVDLITGAAPEDQDGIDVRIEAVSAWLKQHDKALTDKLFKANGRQPGAGAAGAAGGASGLGVRAAQRYAQKLHLGGK